MSDSPEEYVGQGVTVRFDGSKCIHARFCVLNAPGVFRANVVGPWIDPDGASVEAIVGVAHACPSGAVAYARTDGGPNEMAPAVNVARVRENGPVAIHGELHVDGHPATFRATLCRCGASKNKPFCDGSHTAAGFTATGEPPTTDSPALESRDGPIVVRPAPNGPLLVEGNLEICSGTGRTLQRVQKAALCRCGASANKPFCDGSHRKVGFTAP